MSDMSASGVLVCTACGSRYDMMDSRWQCRCGGLLDLCFEAGFLPDALKDRQATLWRYREAIPIGHSAHIYSLGEGFTPLLEITVAGKKVWVKQEQFAPTGSFKDRGAAVLINHVKALGIERIVEDSSGNAGAAIAAYCANMEIQCDIYVPDSTSRGKLAQIESYGATLHKIRGSRDDTAAAVLEAAEKYYYASHVWNPFFFHGVKTFAFEVWEQLGGQVPDTLVLPVGNGSLLLGAFMGFKELSAAGLSSRMPRIIGVQAAGCAPLVKSFKENLAEIPAISPQKTVAEGIAIAQPRRGKQLMDAVKQTNGEFLAVSEDEIKSALKKMHRQGFYIEPTSAVAIAGLEKYLLQSPQPKDEKIISLFTGHGLKAGAKML